jgi:2-dehydro-3-deoxyphosphogluconate aldolase/(4S)-4-hydroxy-2-oxoglutarate aldolase
MSRWTPESRSARVDELLSQAPVLPVLSIEHLDDAVPLARALVDAGLPVLEITLRSAVAIEAIRLIANEVAGAIVGAGTVTNPDQLEQAIDAGSEFIVAPGLTKKLGKAAVGNGVPFLPGVANAADIMRGLDHGLDRFKFFPAEAAGGVKALKALTGPFGQVRFCPTGGITEATAPDWLKIAQVLCVGGSWVVPAGEPQPEAIRRAARVASGLRPH